MTDKKTLVVGASPDPGRYAYLACRMLDDAGIDFVPIGVKKGVLFGQQILDIRDKPALEGIHTITLYLGPANQKMWYEYLASLQPQRVIFNPGAENPEFAGILAEQGIEVVHACNLVLLSTGQY